MNGTRDAERFTHLTIFTIGHSTRSLEELLGLLRECHIGAVADIRRYPGSRRFPHFNRHALQQALEKAGIGYHWFESLGGRRHTSPDAASPNTGLRSEGFRSYADYMMSAEFRRAVVSLVRLASTVSTALMCAEKTFWKCHRRLVSDYLAAGGAKIVHIIEHGKREEHTLSPGARVSRGSVTYPSPPSARDGAG